MGKKLTPQDDRLAALLADTGFSWRQIGDLLGRDDKSVKAAAARGKKTTSDVFTVKQEAAAKRLLGFAAWLNEGRAKGYLAAAAAHLEGCVVVVDPNAEEAA